MSNEGYRTSLLKKTQRSLMQTQSPSKATVRRWEIYTQRQLKQPSWKPSSCYWATVATDTNKLFSAWVCLDETTLTFTLSCCFLIILWMDVTISYASFSTRHKCSPQFTHDYSLSEVHASHHMVEQPRLFAYLGRYWSRPILRRFWTREAVPENKYNLFKKMIH